MGTSYNPDMPATVWKELQRWPELGARRRAIMGGWVWDVFQTGGGMLAEGLTTVQQVADELKKQAERLGHGYRDKRGMLMRKDPLPELAQGQPRLPA